MEITRLTEQDLPVLTSLYQQLLPKSSSLQKMRAAFQRLNGNPDYNLLGAKQDGRLVGSVLGIICQKLFGECRPFMVVEDVVVRSSQRRSGIGSALMRELEKRAADRDCNYIMLVTDSSRTGAQQFYQSLGYECEAYRGFKKYLGRQASL